MRISPLAASRDLRAGGGVEGGNRMSMQTGPTHAPVTRRWGLDILRIVSVVGVVAIHVFGNMVGNDAVRGSARWWAAVVVISASSGWCPFS